MTTIQARSSAGTGASFTPASGTFILVAVEGMLCTSNGSPAGCSGVGTIQVTDSQSDSFTAQVAKRTSATGCLNSGGSFDCYSAQWTTVPAAFISMTITVTNTNVGTSGAIIGWEVYTISGNSGTALCTASGSGTSASTSTSTTCTGDNNAMIGAAAEPSATITTPGTGYIAYNAIGGAEETIHSVTISGSSNFPITMSGGGAGSGTWSEVGASYGASTVTLPVQCSMSSGPIFALLALSGGSPAPNPSSVSCDNSTHNIVVSATTTITATDPAASAGVRYEFLGNGTTTTQASCGSGTCPTWIIHNYQQFEATYTFKALAQTNFDPGLTFQLSVIQQGNANLVSVTSIVAPSFSRTTWSDTGSQVIILYLNGAPTGSQWFDSLTNRTIAGPTAQLTYKFPFYKQFVLNGASSILPIFRTSAGVAGVITTNDYYDSGSMIEVQGIRTIDYASQTRPFYAYQPCTDGTQLITNTTASAVSCATPGQITWMSTKTYLQFFDPGGATITAITDNGIDKLTAATQSSLFGGILYATSGSSSWVITWGATSTHTTLGGNGCYGICDGRSVSTNTGPLVVSISSTSSGTASVSITVTGSQTYQIPPGNYSIGIACVLNRTTTTTTLVTTVILHVNATSSLAFDNGCHATLSLTGTPIPNNLLILDFFLLFLLFVIIALVASRKKLQKAGDALAADVSRPTRDIHVDLRKDPGNRRRKRKD
ncbi:MAG TPA: hypothetical protein VGS11_10840 [Candidatus Bathyarchaeia archaeon]|nr:hypothetical protein [Candidatus Bathyarchaeia archaeon]